MKKTILHVTVCLLSCFCILQTADAQLDNSHWQYSNPKPFGFVSYQISYADNNTALVVGEAGGIAKTTDGGGTWTYFAYTTTNAAGEISRPVFNDVQFVNASLAYAVGNDGIMVKTVDGGTNWSLVATPFYSTQMEINTVCFTDANTGYIAGDVDATTQQATIYKTVNGGASWQTLYTFPLPSISWLSGTIYKVRFSANGVGYVGGAAGLVYKFENGNWYDYSITDSTVFTNVNAVDTVYYANGEGGTDTVETHYSDNTFGLSQQNYRAIAVLNDTVVVLGTQNNGGLIRINTSTPEGNYLMLNNGSSMASRYAPLNSPQIYNLATRDGITVAGTSSEGKILMSADRGITWTANGVYPEGSSEAGISFYGIDISSANRFGLCGQAGIIADSTSSWRTPFIYTKKSLGFSGYGITAIAFADPSYGMAMGSGGAILRTANGGDTWEDISNPSFNPWDTYTSIVYPSPNTVIAAASNGMFYKSLDRGISFDLLFAEEHGGDLTAMDFINEDTGWLVANVRYPDNVNYVDTFHQIIYHTYDGGNSWDSSTTVLPFETDYALNNYLYEIKFLNADIGYVAGANGTVYKTTDGGITWTHQTNVPSFASDKAIKSIAVADANTAYATGDQALVMKTVDGGSTWTLCNTGLPTLYANYPKILMYDANQGLLFGSGSVYTTLNGGASWKPYYAPITDLLSAACFAPITGCSGGICKKVYAAGFFRGNILKLDADVVLPVKFSNLTGTGTPAGNQLFWTAFEQEAVSYFEIERSADGKDFKVIGDKVYPGGLNYQSYQWLDETAAAGKNYYRIKATERSGAVYYTNIVMIASKKAAKWNYIVNNDHLIVNNVKVQKGNVTVMIMNEAGQTVAAKSWNQNGGAFNQVILLPPAARGVYIVKLDNEGAVYSFKILIQ